MSAGHKYGLAENVSITPSPRHIPSPRHTPSTHPVQSLQQGQQGLRQDVQALQVGQQGLRQDVQALQEGQRRIETRMENEVIEKLSALFDGFNLRGNQIDNLKKHLDDRFDDIVQDLNYKHKGDGSFVLTK